MEVRGEEGRRGRSDSALSLSSYPSPFAPTLIFHLFLRLPPPTSRSPISCPLPPLPTSPPPFPPPSPSHCLSYPQTTPSPIIILVPIPTRFPRPFLISFFLTLLPPSSYIPSSIPHHSSLHFPSIPHHPLSFPLFPSFPLPSPLFPLDTPTSPPFPATLPFLSLPLSLCSVAPGIMGLDAHHFCKWEPGQRQLSPVCLALL